MDIAPTDLEALKADPEVYTLVERVRQGLDTEADLRRLSEAIQKRWEALRGERRKMYELYKQRRLLWRLGVVVLALVLLGWGGWRLYLDYKQSADAAAAFRQVLEAWHQGRWQTDSVSLPQAQTLAHLWQTVEESLTALEKGELPPSPPDLSHPLTQRLSHLRQALAARQAAETQQLKTIQGLAAFQRNHQRSPLH